MNKPLLKIDDMEFKLLIEHKDIVKKSIELAQQISDDYNGEELVIVGLLRGAFPFLAELIKHIKIPHIIDFLTVSSYYGRTKTIESVKINMDINVSVKGMNVVVVDDIIDTGSTQKLVVDILKLKKPRSISTCILLDKNTGRTPYLRADYAGFKISNQFVVGFGLDYGEKYRSLPDIYQLVK